MSIDLRRLADKLPYPNPPRKKLWLSFALVLSIGVIALFLFLKGNEEYSLLSWVVVVIIILLMIGIIFSARLFIYEQRYGYIRAWNEQHDRIKKELIYEAQKYVSVVNNVYMAENICNGLSDIAFNQNPLISSKKFDAYSPALRYTRIDRFSGTIQERIEQSLSFLFKAHRRKLEAILLKNDIELVFFINSTSAHKKIDFDSILEPYENKYYTNRSFISENHGFYFLDNWLDSAKQKYVLYCEIALLSTPLNESGEFISLFLLNYEKNENTEPHVAIHRPVKWQKERESLEYLMKTALEWGNVLAKDVGNVWFAGIADSERTEILILMQSLDFSISVDSTINLDWVVGKTQHASGAIAVSCAIEKAKKTNQPQLVIYQADELQMLVVKSVNDNKEHY